MAPAGRAGGEAGIFRLLDRVTRGLAIIGGLLALGLSLLVCASVLGRWASGYDWGQRLGLSAIPGDFELVEMATAIAVFCFMPLCQWRRGNIVVDTFTTPLPAGAIRVIDALWDVVYAFSAAVIGYCLINGTHDALGSHQATMVLGFPLWPAFALSALLMMVLAVVASMTALRLLKGPA